MIEYIEKRDVIDELMDYASRWFAYDPYNKIVARIFQDIELIIKGIPSTDVIEPKRGKWVQGTERQTIIGASEGELRTIYALRCSYCNKEFGTLAKDYNFCPNCGADMRNSSEKSNNCETCRFELYCPEMCEGCCEWDSHYEPKDEVKLCRECEEYAGDGMYCASNHLEYDFDICKNEPHE